MALILHNILTNIPKFNGKKGEDSGSHITTYCIWCVLNYMVDDSVRLPIFHYTLTSNAAKWYIELSHTLVNSFNTLVMECLKNFHLSIYYDTGTKLLTSLRQDTSTHIPIIYMNGCVDGY